MKRISIDRTILLLVILGLLAYIIHSDRHAARQEREDPPDLTGIASAIDGDTIIIHGTHIRLYGIDAPESGQTCKAADGSSYLCGQKAAFVLADMMKDKTVTCQDTGERSYKRVIGRCFIVQAQQRDAGDIDLQREMVREGWAIAYRRYSQDYAADEDQAHAARLGIWAGTFIEPEIWRHKSARQ